MSKMMIIGVKNETGLWLVDFEAGTVSPIDGNRDDFVSGEITTGGETDLDLAVSFNVKEAAFSGVHYKSDVADLAVGFDTVETAFSGVHYKTPEATTHITN